MPEKPLKVRLWKQREIKRKRYPIKTIWITEETMKGNKPTRTCSSCGGSGRKNQVCIWCGGMGRKSIWKTNRVWRFGKYVTETRHESQVCTGCGGSGTKRAICLLCHGTGKISWLRQDSLLTDLQQYQEESSKMIKRGAKIKSGPEAGWSEPFWLIVFWRGTAFLTHIRIWVPLSQTSCLTTSYFYRVSDWG